MNPPTDGTHRPPPQPRTVRFDPEALYIAADRRRREQRMTWRQVCRQVGERTPSAMTRIGQGRHPSADLLVRLMVWLGTTDISQFTAAITASDSSEQPGAVDDVDQTPVLPN